jgi:hypothetical protein
VLTTGATDLGRADKSFDALLEDGIGVGVKTFVAGNGKYRYEKVAEFTALARAGHFRVRNRRDLVLRIASARNNRVLSNAVEYGIKMDRCVYHCLIRFPGGAIVHEEPYELINIDKLKPLTKSGTPAPDWNSMGSGLYFTDGKSKYSYSVSKNVLSKRFDFDRRKNFIKLEIHPDPLTLLNRLLGRTSTSPSAIDMKSITVEREDRTMRKGIDYLVLPLYSLRDHCVPVKSGINQWNAGGRNRKFGEAYVPIPAEVRKRFPHFFPPQDEHFDLLLPNGEVAHRAKVCQQDGKALMTENNVELGRWLISVVDPTVRPSDFAMVPGGRPPYTYDDLVSIGSDAVVVRKTGLGVEMKYSLEFASLGAYEEFRED